MFWCALYMKKNCISVLLIFLLISFLGCNSNSAARKLEARNITVDDKGLIESIDRGDVEAVGLFLETGIDPNHEIDVREAGIGAAPEVYEKIPRVPMLLIAQFKDKTNIVEFLIAHGADPKKAADAGDAYDKAEAKFFEDIRKKQDEMLPSFLGK